MWLTNLITGIVLFALGFLIRKYKMSYLIAGYNTASKEEKEKYDEKKLVTYTGNFLMSSAGILILSIIPASFFPDFEEEIMHASWILFSVYLVIWVIYVNVSGCVKRVADKK